MIEQPHRCRVCGGSARRVFNPWPQPDLCPACAAVTGKGLVPGLPVGDKIVPFADIADFDEDHRIKIIGELVMKLEPGRASAFITDDEPGKAERYIRKLKERFPGVQILQALKDPTSGTVLVKIGPPAVGNNQI